MKHVVVQKAEQRSRKREFLAQVELASEETLVGWAERLETAEGLTAFGAWQLSAISNELELRP